MWQRAAAHALLAGVRPPGGTHTHPHPSNKTTNFTSSTLNPKEDLASVENVGVGVYLTVESGCYRINICFSLYRVDRFA